MMWRALDEKAVLLFCCCCLRCYCFFFSRHLWENMAICQIFQNRCNGWMTFIIDSAHFCFVPSFELSYVDTRKSFFRDHPGLGTNLGSYGSGLFFVFDLPAASLPKLRKLEIENNITQEDIVLNYNCIWYFKCHYLSLLSPLAALLRLILFYLSLIPGTILDEGLNPGLHLRKRPLQPLDHSSSGNYAHLA